MNEDEISAFHEAGHIIVNATIGRRVKCSEIYPSERHGFTDFFLVDEPITLPQNTLAGVVYQLPVKSKESPISWEEATLIAHSDRPLEEYLLTYAAGVEASLIYAEARGWDTEQISEEMEESEDMKRMQLLIAGRKRHDERHELINDARWRARTLLQKADIWNAVCSFALLLIQEQKFQWYSLPENYKQIIDNLIA